MKFWIGIRGAKCVIACALANIHIICYVFAVSFSWFDMVLYTWSALCCRWVQIISTQKILIRWQRYETNQNTIWDTRPKQIAEKKVKEIVMFKTCQRFKKKIKKYNVQRRKLSKLGISLQSMSWKVEFKKKKLIKKLKFNITKHPERK
jgi:hypothetical protein